MEVVVVAGVIAVVMLAFVVVPLFRSREGSPLPSAARDSIDHRNQFIVPAEINQPADMSQVVSFPVRNTAPVTPFEDFNQTLFLLEDSTTLEWPNKIYLRDYPTTVKGGVDEVRAQIAMRLRPAYPTILDTYGWWAEASALLEMNPGADHPVAKAYLAIPANQRPVVISRKATKDDPTPKKLEFFRYQFETFEFDPKFLRGNQIQALYELMLAFTGDQKGWWLFSPARLRKSLFDRRNAETRAYQEQEEFAEQIRRATHKNRFAALWNLPADPPAANSAT